jgi:hypothetical protein
MGARFFFAAKLVVLLGIVVLIGLKVRNERHRWHSNHSAQDGCEKQCQALLSIGPDVKKAAVLPTSCSKYEVCLEHAEVVGNQRHFFESRADKFARLSLEWAMGFTILFTLIQYGTIYKKRGGMKPVSVALILLNAVLVVGSIFYSEYGSDYKKIDYMFLDITGYWSVFFPSGKNALVLVVAIVFLVTDWIEVDLRSAVIVDLAIMLSVFLSSLAVGFIGMDFLGHEFLTAYNTGVLSFHLFLGTLLFEGGEPFKSRSVSPGPLPERSATPGPLLERKASPDVPSGGRRRRRRKKR